MVIKMYKYSDSPNLDILQKAKGGDDEAKLFLINKYIKLILKYSSSYNIKNYEPDDLIQIGKMAVLNSINKYDLSKGNASIDSYMINSIKNAYRYLARSNIKYSDESSLNILVINDNYKCEIIEFLEDDSINVLKSIVDKSSISLLNKTLNTLPILEKTLIKEIYITKKSSLLKYCQTNNLPYGPTRKKLKSTLEILKQAIS